jgi:hypothetical protein
MELFEILFILFFILIPVLEGIRKSRQRGDSEDIELPGRSTPRPSPRSPAERDHAARGDRSGAPPQRPAPPPAQDPEPAGAADMVPDDLWEILTGERRANAPPADLPRETEEPWMAEPGAEWHEEPRWEPEPEPASEERFEPRPWLDSPGAMRDEDAPEPVEIQLPAPDADQPLLSARPPRAPRPPRVSLREVVEAPRVVRRKSPLIRSLQSQEGLRQAVLLKEILGRPKGLDL